MRYFRTLGSISIVIIFVACSLTLPTAIAQTASDLLINYVETSESEDGLALSIYFTAIDSSGRAVAGTAVRSAAVLIDEGNPTRYEASSDKPEMPLFIALVLDASGSMLGAASDMRAAAMQAVNDAPRRAQFAVFGFNDEITLLTNGFTANKQDVVDAIQRVQAVNNRGTCLYDATYQAVELLSQAAPQGRRAAIVFTDGIDEVIVPAPGPCSTHTSGDVIDLATRSDLRVPVHTIGLRGSGQGQINEVDLKYIAAATGGLTAIGGQSDLTDLFKTSMAAIGSQQRAVAEVHPTAGLRTLTLLVSLTDGTPLRAAATFQSPRDHALPLTTATPDLTATPKPVRLEILGIRPIVDERTIILQTNVDNEQLVSSYRIELKNSSTNTLQGDGFMVQPPLENSVAIQVGGLLGGQYEIIIRALDANGRVITSSAGERFTYSLPTPAPTQAVPTSTPLPLGARIQGVQHSFDEGMLRIYMSIYGADKIARLRIELVDQTTRQLIGTPHFSEPAEIAEITGEKLAGGAYEAIVVSVDDAGNELARDVYQFSVTPPTPTSMPTAAPTQATAPLGAKIRSVQHQPGDNVFRLSLSISGADRIEQLRIELFDQATHQLIGTPYFAEPVETAEIVAGGLSDGNYEVVVVAIGAADNELGRDTYEFAIRQPVATPTPSISAEVQLPRVDETTLELVFPIASQNAGTIDHYVLEFIDQDNILTNSFTFDAPPYSELRVALTDGKIKAGQYVVQLRGVDEKGAQISSSKTPPIRITPPSLPQTAGTTSASSAPASFPSLKWARENQPIALAMIGGLILLLLLALVAVTRRAKPAPNSQFWAELSSAQQTPAITSDYTLDPPELDDDATNPYVQMDSEATNPVPHLLLPDARLIIERTRAASLLGQAVPIRHVPFKLGRRGRADINFDEDDNVSREHAAIHFEGDRFTLTDLGSMHGTAINGERISSHTPVPLRHGDQIRLGITTQLVFKNEM